MQEWANRGPLSQVILLSLLKAYNLENKLSVKAVVAAPIKCYSTTYGHRADSHMKLENFRFWFLSQEYSFLNTSRKKRKLLDPGIRA